MSDETQPNEVEPVSQIVQLGTFQKEALELQRIYASDNRGETFRGIIAGKQGSGKTTLALTCPAPVHIDSFDPGGTLVLKEAIEAGTILADVRFEGEDPDDPKMFKTYIASLDRRLRAGYFDHIGTYILDSLTTFGAAALNTVIKERVNKGKHTSYVPQKDDWFPQMTYLSRCIRKIAALPCHVLLLAHEKPIKDKEGNLLGYELLVTGNLQQLIPILFSELYILETKETPEGVKRALMTMSSGMHTAKSRLGRGGRFDKYEQPDIKHLLKKAGLPALDKAQPEQAQTA